MLYHEKRIKPLKSLALHRHIHKCEGCREFFLAMENASEAEDCAAPEGFADAVMAKIASLPAPVRAEATAPPKTDWFRLVGCLYALALSAVLAILYNTELIQIPYPSQGFVTEGRGAAFFGGLAQAGQAAALYAANIAGDFSNFALAIAVFLGLALTFIVMREKSKSEARYE
jgi:hypothetical protein